MKKPWQSWTLWFNALSAVGVVFELNSGMVKEVLGAQSYLGLMFLFAFVNGALRFKTNLPIK